jgi:accessory gene regulator protein AgrB
VEVHGPQKERRKRRRIRIRIIIIKIKIIIRNRAKTISLCLGDLITTHNILMVA